MRGYKWAIGLALTLFALEVSGGIFSFSLALLGDAWHVLSDVIVYGAAVYALRLKLQAAAYEHVHTIDRKWGRFNANILIGVATLNIVLAIGRLMLGLEHVKAGWMLGVASVGLVGNIVMFGLLWKLGIDHGHAHEHTPARKSGFHIPAPIRKLATIGHRIGDWVHGGSILHTLGDLLISVVVVGAAVLMLDDSLKQSLGISHLSLGTIDAVTTIVVSILLFLTARHVKRHIAYDH